MKKALILVAIAALIGVGAQAATVVGTAHDMRTFVTTEGTSQVCVFCHTPHQNAAANGQYPLWNHSISNVAAYGTYTSITMNASPTEIGGVAAGSASVSNLCMSCHDGTIAANALYKQPLDGTAGDQTFITSGNSAYIGTSLTDDHPVNFTYATSISNGDGELNAATGNAELFGGTVQCASCHDVHNDTNQPFLVMSNADSALCTQCHVK